MAAEDVWEKSCCYRPWNGEDGLPIPPYAVYNIGNQNPENLLDFVQILSEELVRAKVLPEDYDFEAHKELVPMQPGDVPVTYADTSALERDFGYAEFSELLTKKKAVYPEYRKARDEMQELVRVQKNVERFFAEEKDTTEKTKTR